MPKELTATVAYRFQCGLCGENYHDESYLVAKSSKHIDVSPETTKKSNQSRVH